MQFTKPQPHNTQQQHFLKENSKPVCKNKLMIGDKKNFKNSLAISLGIVLLNLLQFVLISPYIWHNISKALIILQLLIFLPLIYNMYKYQLSDPGVVKRGCLTFEQAFTYFETLYQEFLLVNPFVKREENCEKEATETIKISTRAKNQQKEFESIEIGNSNTDPVQLLKGEERIEAQQLKAQIVEVQTVQNQIVSPSEEIIPHSLLDYYHSSEEDSLTILRKVEHILQRTVFFNIPNIKTQRYCYTCQIIRAPFVSHCRICNHCVKNFDHHCLIIGNCIGQRNFHNFVLFLLFASIQGLCVATFSAIVFFSELSLFGELFVSFYKASKIFYSYLGLQVLIYFISCFIQNFLLQVQVVNLFVFLICVNVSANQAGLLFQNYYQNPIYAFLFTVSSTYLTIFILPLLATYIHLAGNQLTLKSMNIVSQEQISVQNFLKNTFFGICRPSIVTSEILK